jgi:spoIIIJ-associated protein
VAHAEASARTVEAAVTAAAAQLGLHTDQVDIEVLEDPVPSTFGFIGSPARVRVTPRTTPGATANADATSRPTDQSVTPSPPEVPLISEHPQVPDTAQPLDPDQVAQSASPAAPPESSSDHVQVPEVSGTPDPTGAPVPAGSSGGVALGTDPTSAEVTAAGPTPEGVGTDQVPTITQEPTSSLAGAPSTPAAKPTPVATERDQVPDGVSADGEQRPGSTPGAGDPTPIGTPATTPAPPAAASSEGDGAPPAASATDPSRATRSSRRTYSDEPIEPAMVEADTERAGDFLEGLLDALDVDGDITTWVDEVGGHIDLEGSDLDMLVGSNGETLDALQELTRLAVLRQSKRRVRLLLDINGFRAQHREQLVSVVKATAEQVIKSQEDHEFQPMTPAERKIVHDAVAAIDGVRTESLGEEPNRRVVIQPT